MKIIIVYLLFINSLFAQEFWDVQYSKNDIQHQRNLFSENKIKKIIVNNNYSEMNIAFQKMVKLLLKIIYMKTCLTYIHIFMRAQIL